MVKNARCEYLEAMRKRYCKARKKDKKPILDEFCVDKGSNLFINSLVLAMRAIFCLRRTSFLISLSDRPIMPDTLEYH